MEPPVSVPTVASAMPVATLMAEPPLDLVSVDGSQTFWEIGKAIRQGLRADPNTLEMLFAPPAVVDEPGALQEVKGASLCREGVAERIGDREEWHGVKRCWRENDLGQPWAGRTSAVAASLSARSFVPLAGSSARGLQRASRLLS